jgi:hypothetical protein
MIRRIEENKLIKEEWDEDIPFSKDEAEDINDMIRHVEPQFSMMSLSNVYYYKDTIINNMMNFIKESEWKINEAKKIINILKKYK